MELRNTMLGVHILLAYAMTSTPGHAAIDQQAGIDPEPGNPTIESIVDNCKPGASLPARGLGYFGNREYSLKVDKKFTLNLDELTCQKDVTYRVHLPYSTLDGPNLEFTPSEAYRGELTAPVFIYNSEGTLIGIFNLDLVIKGKD